MPVLSAICDIPQLGLPHERVVGALEDLALLGDRVEHRLEGRTTIRDPERPAVDLLDDLHDPAPDRAEVLEPLLPQEPRPVGPAGILAPLLDQRFQRTSHRSPIVA